MKIVPAKSIYTEIFLQKAFMTFMKVKKVLFKQMKNEKKSHSTEEN